VNGVDFARQGVYLTGTLRFDAPDVVLPPFSGNSGGIVVSAPFFFGVTVGFCAWRHPLVTERQWSPHASRVDRNPLLLSNGIEPLCGRVLGFPAYEIAGLQGGRP